MDRLSNFYDDFTSIGSFGDFMEWFVSLDTAMQIIVFIAFMGLTLISYIFIKAIFIDKKYN